MEKLKKGIIALGLEQPARRLWSRIPPRVWKPLRRTLQARGWIRWTPLVPEEAFSSCILHAIETLRKLEPDGLGPYLEFGVSRGNSMVCAWHSLCAAGLRETRLIGFDSFEGLPPESAEEGWPPGAYHSTFKATRRHLQDRGVDLDRVTLVKGWFRDSLTEETRAALAIGTASLIMIDCDIYSFSAKALAFCGPHIGRHAVIFFDDWGWREKKGEIGQKEAFQEFLANHPDISAEPMPSYLPEARVFLLRRHSSKT